MFDEKRMISIFFILSEVNGLRIKYWFNCDVYLYFFCFFFCLFWVLDPKVSKSCVQRINRSEIVSSVHLKEVIFLYSENCFPIHENSTEKLS